MRIVFVLLLLLSLLSCSSIEERIKEHSYTEYWYYHGGIRYQLYKTKYLKRYYIIIYDENKEDLRRKYIVKPQIN